MAAAAIAAVCLAAPGYAAAPLPAVPDPGLPTELPDLPLVPPLPQVPETVAPPAPAVPSTPAVPGTRSGAPASGAQPSSPSSGSPATGSGSASGSGGSAEGGSAGTAATPSRRSARARRERRLRRTVERLRGCLGALDAQGRRVLVLRSGVGSGRPMTRAGVARRVGTSTRQVRSIERSALRRLRSAGRDGGCGGGGFTVTTAPASTGSVEWPFALASATRFAVLRAASPSGRDDSEGPDRQEVLGAAATAATAAEKARAIARGTAAVIGDAQASNDDGALPYVLAGLALVALAAGAGLLLGRRRREAGAAPSAGWVSETDERRRR